MELQAKHKSIIKTILTNWQRVWKKYDAIQWDQVQITILN